MISKEEKELRVKRHKQFLELLAKYKVRNRRLSELTGIGENNLSSYRSGKIPISDSMWARINDAIKIIDQEQFDSRPDVEVEEFNYVIQQLKLHGNTTVNRSKIKDIGKYLNDLELNGFVCKIEKDRDGDYLITDRSQHKSMVEKVIQPKQVVEPTVGVISKVHKMHEDALVLHEEALKIQKSTEEIVKSVDDMEAKFTVATQEDVDKIVPGMREGMPAFKEALTEIFPDVREQITITDEDILEAVEHNKKLFALPPAEEAELKELAEEVIENCGIEKTIHSIDLIQFLETRLTKQEVRGFLRGKAIESLLEEDYQTASMCIGYFMEKGYAPEEMRL